MNQEPKTAAEFANFITYRGPQVEIRKERFEEINHVLALHFEALTCARVGTESARAIEDAQRLAHRIGSDWMQLAASDGFDRLVGLHARGRTLDPFTVTAALMHLRMWLNLALLHDELGTGAIELPKPRK
jgi:hypothetical protein